MTERRIDGSIAQERDSSDRCKMQKCRLAFYRVKYAHKG
jgi:hypothetical protein